MSSIQGPNIVASAASKIDGHVETLYQGLETVNRLQSLEAQATDWTATMGQPTTMQLMAFAGRLRNGEHHDELDVAKVGGPWCKPLAPVGTRGCLLASELQKLSPRHEILAAFKLVSVFDGRTHLETSFTMQPRCLSRNCCLWLVSLDSI